MNFISEKYIKKNIQIRQNKPFSNREVRIMEYLKQGEMIVASPSRICTRFSSNFGIPKQSSKRKLLGGWTYRF